MSVTATSPVAIAKAAMRRLVASSATFQDVVGASNENAALDRVHLTEASDDFDELDTVRIKDIRPRAMVDFQGIRRESIGVAQYREYYDFIVSFEFPPPDCATSGVNGEHLADECTWFDNQWGAIVKEMGDNSGGFNAAGEGYSSITDWETSDGPMRNNPDEDPQNQYYYGVAVSMTVE